MTYKDCTWCRRCALERRGSCREFKPKGRQPGQSASHKLKRGGVIEQTEHYKQDKD